MKKKTFKCSNCGKTFTKGGVHYPLKKMRYCCIKCSLEKEK